MVKNVKKNVNIGTRKTFADIAATVEELLLGTEKKEVLLRKYYKRLFYRKDLI